jgi:hypothetical protein
VNDIDNRFTLFDCTSLFTDTLVRMKYSDYKG